jgi:hypothetical protein
MGVLIVILLFFGAATIAAFYTYLKQSDSGSHVVEGRK